MDEIWRVIDVEDPLTTTGTLERRTPQKRTTLGSRLSPLLHLIARRKKRPATQV